MSLEPESPNHVFTRHDMVVGPFWTQASEQEQAAQRQLQQRITARGSVKLGQRVYISQYAAVYADQLTLGDDSHVAAYAYLWGELTFGKHCTVNSFSEVRGHVRIGDGVRIGAHTSLLGFNHGMDPHQPIYQQPLTMAGITIGDDVWIGTHVVILDGVAVGSHSIIGAGAIVTKDVAPWSIVAGNPARHIRDRRPQPPARPVESDLSVQLHQFGQKVRGQAEQLINRYWQEDTSHGTFVDRPGAKSTVRAWCDAVELSHLLLNRPPAQVSADYIVHTLKSRQDPATGLIPEFGDTCTVAASSDGRASVNYHILAAGYALELLGERFDHPIAAMAQMSSAELRRSLGSQPWREHGWQSGGWVDAVGTAFYRNGVDFHLDTEIDTLFGWLLTHCDPATGLWSPPHPTTGWMEAVNGFYRLTRGTFAQFGIPLPYPERAIDSILTHTRDGDYFRPDRGTACNVLDVIHPLWLAGRQTPHRRSDGQAWARTQLDRILPSWSDDAGFSFALGTGTRPDETPGLQGTEMWLSIIWLLADHLDLSDTLGYRPNGVHRPEPGIGLGFRPERHRAYDVRVEPNPAGHA